VMHSQSRTPKLYASTASVSRAPSNISGAMYAGVPAWLLRVLMYVLRQQQRMWPRLFIVDLRNAVLLEQHLYQQTCSRSGGRRLLRRVQVTCFQGRTSP